MKSGDELEGREGCLKSGDGLKQGVCGPLVDVCQNDSWKTVITSDEMPSVSLRGVGGMARKHRSPVKLHPAVYDAWLKEEPKRIDGGPIVLKTPSNPVDAEEVYFGSRVVRTNKLPPQYAENLMIYSEYDEFSGSKFHVGPKRPADYLLAAHQLHCGSFNDYLGQEFVNGEAHYHEWDYYSTKGDGSPSKRTKVPPSLSPGMAAHELLEAFLNDYHFDDGRDGPVTPAMKPKLIQERL